MLLMLIASSIELWSLDKLIPYARNARTHSDAGCAELGLDQRVWLRQPNPRRDRAPRVRSRLVSCPSGS
jgi:hypothetical protein